jgi:hypothetical protein
VLWSRLYAGIADLSSIILIPEYNGHPRQSWFNRKTGDFWPNWLLEGENLSGARVWSYGYHGGYEDDTPLSSVANNFIGFYAEQRLRDRKVGNSNLLMANDGMLKKTAA